MQSKLKSLEEPQRIRTSKSGCSFAVRNDFNEVKFKLSTVSLKPLKTVNLDIEFWVDSEWVIGTKNIDRHFREVKTTIREMGTIPFFKEHFISINQTPERMCYSKGFVRYEFTLFTDISLLEPMIEVPVLFYDLVDDIYYKHFCEKEQFSKKK